MRLVIKSVPENVIFIERFVKEVVKALDVQSSVYADIYISLTEAVNNAMIHGNDLDQNKEVSILSFKEDNFLIFKVSDQGSGFCPEELVDPTNPAHIALEGGRGVLIMKSLCSKLNYLDNGSTVQLKFKIA